MVAARASLLLAAAAAALPGTSAGPPCPLPLTGGQGYRWPRENPALAAPAYVSYDYRAHRQPLEAELTREAIHMPVPPELFASFNITDEHGVAQEQYALRSMEIRKPPRLPEGASQVMSHVLEAVLLHEDVAGKGHVASVVVPFSVSVDPAMDMLSAILAGSRLPDRYGERSPVLLSAAQPLELAAVFDGASFLTYWTKTASLCGAGNVSVRQLMRNGTIETAQSTFAAILKALERAPEQPPLVPPSVAWNVGTCEAGVGSACGPAQAEDLSPKLAAAQTLQAAALKKLRAAKEQMNQALLELANVTELSYSSAVSSRDALRDAEAELDSASRNVERLQAWVEQAKTAVWNADAPESAGSAPAPAAQSLMATGAVTKTRQLAGSATGDCTAMGLSPIAINSSDVARKQAGSGRRKPLLFQQVDSSRASAAKPPVVHLYNTGNYVRLMVPPGQGAPLGALLLGGVPHPVTYADLHAPGEHRVDGAAAAAELQLVHLSGQGRPATAVAVRLELAEDAPDNAWLEPLLAAMPRPRADGLAQLATGAAAPHAALRRGSADRYFRYDGTLTRTPCTAAEWYILKDHALISRRQVDRLRALLPSAAAAPAPRAFEPAGLVAEDVQELTLTSVGSAGGAEAAAAAKAGPRLTGLLSRLRAVQPHGASSFGAGAA